MVKTTERRSIRSKHDRCTVKTEQKAAFLALVARLIEESRQHHGGVSYDAGWENEAENRFCFIERWQTQEDLDAHLASPFFAENAPILVEMTENGLDIHPVALL